MTGKVRAAELIPAGELYAQLRVNAKGLYPLEAATELLIRSDVWLRRCDFVQACVETWGPTEEHPHLEVGSSIRWEVIGEALAALESVDEDIPQWLGVSSGGERRLIQIAYDIEAGPMSNVCGIDRNGQELVLAAIAHAGGSHEHKGNPFRINDAGDLERVEGAGDYLGSLYPWPAAAR